MARVVRSCMGCRTAPRPGPASGRGLFTCLEPPFGQHLEGRNMIRELQRLLRDESGEDLIEYGLLAAFVSSLATAVFVSDPLHMVHAFKKIFQEVEQVLTKAGK